MLAALNIAAIRLGTIYLDELEVYRHRVAKQVLV